MVRSDYTMDLIYSMKVSFLVHKLEQERQVPVGNIGDKMLLYAKGGCYSWSGAGPSNFFGKNCIYPIDWRTKNKCNIWRFSAGAERNYLEIPPKLQDEIAYPCQNPFWFVPRSFSKRSVFCLCFGWFGSFWMF